MEAFNDNDFEKLSYDLQRQSICDHLSRFSIGKILEDHARSRFAVREDKKQSFDGSLLFDLATISTWSDGYTTAGAMVIGPIKFDELSEIDLRAAYYNATELPVRTMGEPLELNVKTTLGPRDADSPTTSETMTESRPATMEDLYSIGRLLKIAHKRAKHPTLYPLDPEVLRIIQEDNLPELATMYPSAASEPTDLPNSEKFEQKLDGYFAADKAGTQGEIIFRRELRGGAEQIIKVSKEDNDYELKVFNPESYELTIYAVGPFSNNKKEEGIIEPLNNSGLVELDKWLEEGIIIRGVERKPINEAIDEAEEQLKEKQDDGRFQDEGDFPGLF